MPHPGPWFDWKQIAIDWKARALAAEKLCQDLLPAAKNRIQPEEAMHRVLTSRDETPDPLSREQELAVRAKVAEEKTEAMGQVVHASNAQVKDLVELGKKYLAERDALAAKLEAAENDLKVAKILWERECEALETQLDESTALANLHSREVVKERDALAVELDEVRETFQMFIDGELSVDNAEDRANLSLPPGARGKEIVAELVGALSRADQFQSELTELYKDMETRVAVMVESQVKEVMQPLELETDGVPLAEQNKKLRVALENAQHKACQGCRENWPIDAKQEPIGEWHVQPISAKAGPIYVGCSALRIKAALARAARRASRKPKRAKTHPI